MTVLGLFFIAAVFLVPMGYRIAAPIPDGDLKLIETFLKDRNQTLVDVRKLWVGGPPRYGGRSIYAQIGRPYQVVARSGDGAEWKHNLAAVPSDDISGKKLMERSYGVWTPVLQ